MPDGAEDRYHRGSMICESFELRVTGRCQTVDLEVPAGRPLEDLRSHAIVDAFCAQRSVSPIGTRKVGPEAGARTIYRLGHTHDHRGATWHDDEAGVVWLVAARRHRSGEPDDAFPYFHGLIDDGVIYPTSDDYEALFEEQSLRFIELAPGDAKVLTARARVTPDVELSGRLGGDVDVGVVVTVVDTMEELFVAVELVSVDDYTQLVVILDAFAPGRADDWHNPNALPTRALRPSEYCFSVANYGDELVGPG